METALLSATILSGLIWCGLILFHGRFWRADQFLSPDMPKLESWPDVVAIIPARNEVETIKTVAEAHGRSDYPGSYSVIVVDDHSDDGTAAHALDVRSPRALSIISASDLQPGWSGKLWALKAGLDAVADMSPDAKYILLTDADILHSPDTARSLVLKAEADSLSLVSLMALLDCRGFWGKLLVPPFIFFFQKLYPFPKINDPKSGQAGAAGGCILVRRDALAEIGGIEAVKGALIDDCTLAAAIKGKPPKRAIWLGLTSSVRSLRDNRSIGSIWTMVARTAFTQLRHSDVLLLLSIVGMALTYLAGPTGIIFGVMTTSPAPAIAGGFAWILSAIAYWPTLRLYRLNPLWTFALPVAALLYSMMTFSSALNHWRGKGERWKGRNYSNLARNG